MGESTTYAIRQATRSDAAAISRHRCAMFQETLSLSDSDMAGVEAASIPWLEEALGSGMYVGFLSESSDGNIAASIGLELRERPPVPGCLRVGRWAHVVNLYTEPSHRRLGMFLAARLMKAVLTWCETHNMDLVTLISSEGARPLYESLGFVDSANHMRLGNRGAPITSA